MANPRNPSDQTETGAVRDWPARSRRFLSALGTVRLLLVATILVPVIMGTVAAYLSYRNSFERAAASASEAVAVAAENTAKVLDTHLLVAARIEDLLGTLTDEQIRASEKRLHDIAAQQIAGLPQIAAAWVVDASGHELVSARIYPVNRGFDQSNREDFAAFRKSDGRAYIWALRARSLDSGDFEPYFTVSLRRLAPDGQFNGVIVIALSGSYFASFYDSLFGGAEQYSASILKNDGTVLTQYPASTSAAPAQPDPLVAKAIENSEKSGTSWNGGVLEDVHRVVAIQRVGSYPVYVTIERGKASIRWEWLRSVPGYIFVGVPSAAGLILLSLVALRRTRREQAAQARAAEALQRRAALEVQLHRAQRLEAAGLLTAGIAHDFNNLLTIVAGNVERLEDSLDDSDHRRLKIIAAAKEGCARAAALSKRLLGFTGRDPADPRPIDINEAIVNTLDMPWRSGKRITSELLLAHDAWAVSVDPDQFTTALLNLAFNAQDAMPNGGKLTVETVNTSLDDPATAEAFGVSTGDYVGVIVADTGHGMPEEVREKALAPFFTTKEPGKGTGLGLSLVNAFAKTSGGYCTIDSEQGRGAAIGIYLPRHIEAPREATSGSGEDAVSHRLEDATGDDS